ncbi:DUF4383 domain-containing protein [Nocardiopsis coralliicola]
MKFERTRTADRTLDNVYRAGAGIAGTALIALGVLGIAGLLAPFATRGLLLPGISTDAALGFTAVAFGALLLGAAVLGGPFASTVELAVGAGFVLAGLGHLVLFTTEFNPLAMAMPNVFFALAAGLALLFTGAYGRFAGGLPEDNPFRRHRIRRAAAGR